MPSLARQFMITYRRTEDSQFHLFNQGEYGDPYKVDQVWNAPAAAAFDDNKGCSRLIQNLFRLGSDDVCETFRKKVPAKRKIWEVALYNTKFRAGRSYFWFLRDRYTAAPRKLEENIPSAGELTVWTLSKWNMDDARGLVPDFSEKDGDGSLQRLSASSASVIGSVLRQEFNTLTETNTKRVLQKQCSIFLQDAMLWTEETMIIYFQKLPNHVKVVTTNNLWVMLFIVLLVLEFLSLGFTRRGHEPDHSLRPTDMVKNEWSFTSTVPSLCNFVVWTGISAPYLMCNLFVT